MSTSSSLDLDELNLDDEVRAAYKASQKHDRWQRRKEEIQSELLGEPRTSENIARKRIENSLKASNKHDELLTAVTSAFHSRSSITGATGWRVIGIEPLYELDPGLRNPDAILGHPERDHVIVIECKAGLSSPQNSLSQLREAAENVLQHADYLVEQSSTAGFDQVERVLLIPGPLSDKARRAIDTELTDSNPQNPIFLWKYYTFSQEQLQLHTRFANRSERESTHDNQLSEQLSGDGISVTRDPLATGDFYPESSIYKIMQNVCFNVATARESSDSDVRKLTREEVVNEIDDPTTMIHYALSDVAEHVADRLIETLCRFDLLSEINPDEDGYRESVDLFEYRGRINGQTATTLIRNLDEKYIEEWELRIAEKETIKQTAEEFIEGQGSLP